MNAPSSPQSELLAKALEALRDARVRLDRFAQQAHGAIAVVGMDCRVPGAADPDALWQLLADGRDAIGEITADRWDMSSRYSADRQQPGTIYSRHAGLLDDIAGFDAAFFGITPREALSLDPQQRLVLESAWHALEDAGIDSAGLAGSPVGVFVGATARDYAARLQDRQADVPIDAYFASGNALNFISGRVAYTLGLNGPALCVDTACSSSLTAVHLAMRSLRQQECRLALAGGVNVILAPELSEAACRLNFLAADGRCKSFDASADGIVRSEGCGMLVLMRLEDARAGGQPVLAVLRGSAINQDGASSGLMTPNPTAQVDLIRAALTDAGVTALDIDYVEAHGTGTALGDPMELRALGQVFGDPARAGPLWVSTVKTNLGHLESAAGVIGLIKTILSLREETLPAHLHLRQPTPHVDWQSLPLRVPVQSQPWPRSARVRRAGVSAFGGSGSNAHIIVEEAPTAEPADCPASPALLMLSAPTASALETLRLAWADRLRHCASTAELHALCAKANRGRVVFGERLAASGVDAAALADALHEVLPGSSWRGSAPARRPRIVFLFTGQASHYAGMGRELYAADADFRQALDAQNEGFLRHTGQPLDEVLWHPAGDWLANTRYAQPALFALQHALCCAWRARGVEPDVVLGHSVGELAAACAAGVFDPAAGLQLAAARGQLMDSLCGPGKMAAVAASSARVQVWASSIGDVTIAARNTAEQTVVAGSADAVDRLCQLATGEGVAAATLPVSQAFHSARMTPMLGAFAEVVRGLRLNPPKLTMLSSLSGMPIDGAIAQADHWVRHVREPVAFAQALEALPERHDVLIEIGPGRTLLNFARQAGLDATAIESLVRGDEASAWLRAQAQLYCRGVAVRPSSVASPIQVRAPAYPFERKPLLVEARDTRRLRDQDARLRDALIAWCWEPVAVPQRPVPVMAVCGIDTLSAAAVAWAGDEAPPAGARTSEGVIDVRALQPIVGDTPLTMATRLIERFVASYRHWCVAMPGKPYWLCIDVRESLAPETAMAGEALCAAALSMTWEPQVSPLAIVRCRDDDRVACSAALALHAPDVADEPLWQWSSGGLARARLDHADWTPLQADLPPGDTVVVTGGFGDLGLALLESLATMPHRQLVVLSRMSEAALDASRRQRLAALRSKGAAISHHPCDVSDAAAVQHVLQFLREEGARVSEIYHLAGALLPDDSGPLDAWIGPVAGAKLDGAWALHQAVPDARLILVSSAAALWGSAGYAAYSAGNAALIGLARARAAQGLPTLCLALGPVDGTRMAQGSDGSRTELAGLSHMSPSWLAPSIIALAARASGVFGIVEAQWLRFADAAATRCRAAWFGRLVPSVAPVPAGSGEFAERDTLCGMAPAPRRDRLLGLVTRDVEAVLRLDSATLNPDHPLHALGVDSVLALELRNQLSQRFGLALPATLIFEHPTAAALAAFVDERLFASTAQAARIGASSRADTDEPIAIVGMSARFSGGAGNIDAYWRNLLDGVDGIVDRPDQRFDTAAWLASVSGDADGPYTMAMGMLDDIEQFDAALFGIAPREARAMDPQQRLTLEGTWHALEHANIDPMSLRGSRTGVFIGVAENDYMPLLLREKPDVVPDMAYLGTGNKVNVIAGRVSYVFGLEGPSMVIDTACSSSAVAIHLACRSLRDAECDLAVAGGVNLVLDPYSYTLACRARMLAADGRCKSFDQRADGFVRAEGCGLLVLKRLSDAQRDADRIVAVVRGSAVNQDGRSSSLTAPNPQAQQRLIQEALAAAGADPGSVGYVEAHGTGTQLGDPIELRALNAVFGASPRTTPLLVGTAKSLIGHAEAAAGVAGVIKLALSLQTGVLPANRHFGALNAEAAEVAASIAVVDRNRPWPAEARLGGVSSFGFSGTNAHLVLEVPPARENGTTEALPVLCIGAADAERVEQLVLRWREVLAGADAAAFTALCAASRHGRWAGNSRLALAATDMADAQRQLENRRFVYQGDASARVVLRLDVPAATALRDGALAVEQARLAADAGVAADDIHIGAFLSIVALCNRLQALGVVVSIWQCGSAPREALAVAAGVLAPRDAVRLLRGETLPPSAFGPARSVCLDRQGRNISSEIAQPAFWQRPDTAATDLAATAGVCPLDELSIAWHRGDTDVMRDAHLLAAAFARGFAVDWQDAGAARADAPLYPFARVRHWPHSQWPLVPVRPARAASAASHYLLGERRRLPRSNEIRFSRRFSASSPAYVNHHRLLDTAVVPAASHLSMVLSAWRAQGGDWPCTIEDLNLLHPLVLQDEGARDVELILRRDGDRFAVELVSCDVSAVNDDSAWVTHMRCTLRGGAAPTSPPVSAETVRSTWQPTIAHDAFYRRFWEHGYTLGSSFRWLGDGWIDAGCTVRRMRTPELPDEVQDFDLYPGLIDGCFSVLSSGQLAWMQQMDEGHIVIPVSIERIEFHGWKTPHGECWTHAAADHAVSDGARARENICLFEPDGHVVARIVGFETRRAQRDALRLGYREPVRDWLYRVVWQEQPAPPPARRSAPLWLIDGGGALADALAVAVADRLVQRTTLDALDRAASPASSALDIVWLMPAATAGDLPLQRLLTLWQRLSGAALRLRLSVVTQHGVQVSPDDSLLPESCALWGLVRGMAAEHPEAELRLCDIGATDPLALQLDAVLRVIDADERETQCAWRTGHRHVARLERHRRQRGYPDLTVRADARYIVTGGLGGIGAAAVRWLIEAGAGCVQVVARRTADSTWHELQNVARAHRTRLELVIADLADEPTPATLWDAPEPVAGILHLAGVVDDAAVLRTSTAQLSRVLSAKWMVGEQLTALALRTRPDFVVFFGSLAATLPAQGQAAYAAANAALEALAARLRGEGVAATCVGFGPWAAVGMSARLGGDYERRLVESGLNPIRADQGLHVLGQLVQDGHAALIAASVHWSRFLERRSEYATSPLLDAFASERPSAGAGGDTTAGDLRRVLEALPTGQRAARLADALRQAIAAVLGLADGGQVGRQQRLFDLGLDSMAAMDLREVLQRRLDLRLRATVLFDYPSVDALGGFVLEELFGTAPALQAPATAARFSAEQVAALSDEEAEALLLAEMKE